MRCLDFPVIDESDYESFWRIMRRDLPAAYDEWFQRHTNRLAEYSPTHKIVEVKVKSDDFIRYITTRGHGADLNRLYDFAEFVLE